MNVELINTGTELMLGRVLNTHQQWLCRRLADSGYGVTRQVAVADSTREIEQAVREALGRADLVVTTGGMGPTSADLTRECLARMLGRSLREDPEVSARLEGFFKQRGRVMPERTRVQAMVPDGAVVLQNAYGTAPGLALEVAPNRFRDGGRPSWLVMLPGPPRELRPMFDDAVAPLLARVLPPPGEFVCRMLRTTGIGESQVEEAVAGPLRDLVKAGLDLGFCARPGQVDVRVAAAGARARERVEEAAGIVTRLLGPRIYGAGEEELEAVIVGRLASLGKTLALAESCTGGCIAHLLTNVPGASAVLLAGVVAYTNEAKRKFLGVRAETLAQNGAVSEAVALEMAQGARSQTGADYALSVTGIAGPAGGTDVKPVGTVFVGLAGPFATVVERHFNPFDRQTFKQVTAQQAMDLLRRTAK
ncbi:MAG: competence/damage-inducible protein A [Limisphaerales bacterium]